MKELFEEIYHEFNKVDIEKVKRGLDSFGEDGHKIASKLNDIASKAKGSDLNDFIKLSMCEGTLFNNATKITNKNLELLNGGVSLSPKTISAAKTLCTWLKYALNGDNGAWRVVLHSGKEFLESYADDLLAGVNP